jgi:hypothetical protein
MTSEQKHTRSSVTARAIIALAIIPLNSYWIIQIESIWYSGHPTTASLFYNVVFIVVVLICFNAFLKKFVPKSALTQGELLTVYVMLCMSSYMSSHDMMQIMVPTLSFVFWYATPENEWSALFHPNIPSWLVVSDKNVLKGYYEGGSSLYILSNLRAWLLPILMWFTFIMAIVLIMFCLNLLVRKHWIETEKLTYPIIQLPLIITEKGGTARLFTNKYLLTGFGISAGIDLLNGLNVFIPSIPTIPVKVHDISPFFVNRPWNAVGWTLISFYPFIIGMSFFMPLDMSFSCWFFFLCRKAQLILASAIGRSDTYLDAQSSGAWLGLCFVALWTTRKHLVQVIRKVIGLRTSLDDDREPIRYRVVFIMLVCAALYITIFCYKAGMSIWVIPLFFGLYLATCLAVTRMRAELGPPTHELLLRSDEVMVDMFGSSRLGNRNLTLFSYFWFLNRDYRSNLMPHQLESLKLAEKAQMDSKKLFRATVLAAGVGVFAGFWAFLHLAYKFPGGPSSGFGNEIFLRVQTWIEYPSRTDLTSLGFMGVGMGMTFFLMLMRMRFLWWPLHPAGYTLANTFGLDYYWFCLIISSFLKWSILRYGGLRLHKKAIPFFLGLILGEFVIGSFWSALSVILQRHTYTFWIF